MKIAELKRLFVHDSSRFTEQRIDEKGKVIFIDVKSKIEDDFLKKHIEGQVVVGTYPVSKKDGTCKWFCVDIDTLSSVYTQEGFKLEDYKPRLKEMAENVKSVFALNNIKSYIEDTGGKGMHVWVFFSEPVHVDRVKRAILPILKSIEFDEKVFDIEYFPTSETSKSVKIPFGKNRRYDKHSIMECPIDQIERTPISVLFNLTNPMEAVFKKCAAFRTLKEKADIEKKLSHQERLAIAAVSKGRDLKDLDFIENYFFSQLANYDETVTKKNLHSIASQGEAPVTCAYLQEKGICLAQCPEIGASRSPIAFYYEETRDGRQAGLGEAAFIRPQDEYMTKSNCFWRATRKGEWLMVSNFTLEVIQQEYIEDHDEKVLGIFKCRLVTESQSTYEFEIDMEEYEDNGLLRKRLLSILGLGTNPYLNPDEIKHIKLCCEKNSRPITISKTTLFGYSKEKDANKEPLYYFSPTVKIDKESITHNDKIIVEVTKNPTDKERKLDFALPVPERSEEYWKSFVINKWMQLYNPNLIVTLMSHVFGAFLKYKLGKVVNQNPYIVWLTGKSGTGKSKLCMTAQRFFGRFEELRSFGSTVMSLQFSGSFYKDALFVIDDFKQQYFQNKTHHESLMNVLQSYADNSARGRMDRSGTRKQAERAMKGQLIINGEDFVTQEASIIARTLIIGVTEKDVTRDIDLYTDIQDTSLYINEFTPHIVKWCMNVDGDEIIACKENYLKSLMELPSASEDNKSRVIINLSTFMACGVYAIKYLFKGNDEKIKEMTESFEKFSHEVFYKMMDLTGEQAISHKVWNAMIEMLATRRIAILARGAVIDDTRRQIPQIGFVDELGDVYININMLYDNAKRYLSNVNPLTHSDKSVRDALIEDDYIEKDSVRKHFGGQRLSFYKVVQEKGNQLQDIHAEN